MSEMDSKAPPRHPEGCAISKRIEQQADHFSPSQDDEQSSYWCTSYLFSQLSNRPFQEILNAAAGVKDWDENLETFDFSRSSMSQEQADSLVAKEMNGLSIEEREKVLHDLHGIVDVAEEEPIFIAEKFSKLDSELAKRTTAESVFGKAKIAFPEYVNDPSFLLKFLRATQFDIEEAADRL